QTLGFGPGVNSNWMSRARIPAGYPGDLECSWPRLKDSGETLGSVRMAVNPSGRSRRCEVFKHRGFRAGIATLAGGGLLAGCASDGGGLGRAEPQFGYQLPTTPVTTNAGSAVGVATDAAKLSARLYPGAFLAGPEGQMLPNRDLVEVTPSEKHQEVVDYK